MCQSELNSKKYSITDHTVSQERIEVCVSTLTCLASVSTLWRFLEGLSVRIIVSCESDESSDDGGDASEEDATVWTGSNHDWRSRINKENDTLLHRALPYLINNISFTLQIHNL